MKGKAASFLAVFLLAVMFLPSFAKSSPTITTTISPSTSDTYISAWYPSTAYGSESKIFARNSGGSFRPSDVVLVKFDLTMIPSGSTINSAVLKLWEIAGGKDFGLPQMKVIFSVYRVDSFWDESTTWNTGPAVESTPTDSIEFATRPEDVGYFSWNVASDVQLFVTGSANNYGWGVNPDPLYASMWAYGVFSSREGVCTKVPQLVVEYTPPPGTLPTHTVPEVPFGTLTATAAVVLGFGVYYVRSKNHRILKK
jgi:hypothetical protein